MGQLGDLTVTMPRHVITRFDGRDMYHGVLQLQVRMQLVGEFLARSRRSSLKLARHAVMALKHPVVLVQESWRRLVLAHWSEEGSQQRICRRQLHQRVYQQRALLWPRGAHAQPALPHAEHGTRAQPIVQVIDGVDAAAGIPGVKFLPSALKHPIVDTATAVALGLPTLDASAVDMRAERKGSVSGLADAQTVGVAEGVRNGDWCRRRRLVPEQRHELLLHLD